MVTTPMRLLDLFCGAGGASEGYARAGFQVVGVDKDPQPNYPFEFIQADALEFMDRMLAGGTWEWLGLGLFDAITASPPCQAYASLANKDGRHPKLIVPTRDRLIASGKPYVIENITDARAELRDPVQLCGSAFGLHVRRHRLFESNRLIMGSDCRHKAQGVVRAYYGKPGTIAWKPPGWDNVQKEGRKPLYRGTVDQAPADMGIDWMTWDELREAIPPAYTEWIGHQIAAHLRNAPLLREVVA